MPRHLSKIPSTRYLLRRAPARNHLASRLLWQLFLVAMLGFVPALLLAEDGWRRTTDNISKFPRTLKASQRPRVLSKLDPMLPVFKAALNTDGVQ